MQWASPIDGSDCDSISVVSVPFGTQPVAAISGQAVVRKAWGEGRRSEVWKGAGEGANVRDEERKRLTMDGACCFPLRRCAAWELSVVRKTRETGGEARICFARDSARTHLPSSFCILKLL